MGKEPAKAFRLVDDLPEVREKPSAKSVELATPKAASAPETPEDPVARAVARALSLLTYGDMSRRKLLRKLTDRGVAEDVAEMAADVLEEKGFLREGDACRRRAEQGVRKGWGRRRVAEDLYSQRYPRELIEATLEELDDEVDYTEACACVIRKKYRGVPEDRDERRRMTAALGRLGYGMDEIRCAMETVATEDEEI